MAYFGNSGVLGANDNTVIAQHNTDLHDRITGLIFSDKAGVLHVEQSGDGTNWDWDDTVTVVVSTGVKFSFELSGPYVRLRYVNGAAAQTVFRLAARFSSAGDS